MTDIRFDTKHWVRCLEDELPRIREEAAVRLGLYKPNSIDAILALAKALKDTNLGVAQNAAMSLCSLGKDSEPALPLIIEALGHHDPIMLRLVVSTLGAIGPPAIKATFALEQLLVGELEPGVKDTVIEALESIRGGQ